jgi:membrane associated rhomboid family serine protease
MRYMPSTEARKRRMRSSPLTRNVRIAAAFALLGAVACGAFLHGFDASVDVHIAGALAGAALSFFFMRGRR